MKRQVFIRIGAAALAVAGLLWCIKAGTIIVMGYQPPLSFELGQILFSAGIIGIYLTFDRAHRLEKIGVVVAILSLVGAVSGLFYPLLPGAQISTGDEFIFPYSLLVLIGSIGGFAALLIMGIAILRSGKQWKRWQTVPMIVALSPIPLIATGLIHIEIPIFFIGLAWLLLAYGLWQTANTSAFSEDNQSAA